MPLTYFYIASCSHSGTTLLSKCLGSQPGVLSLGEFKHFASYVASDRTCGCGTSLQSCSFWSRVLEDLEVDADALDQTHPTDGVRTDSWTDGLYAAALLFAPLLRTWEQLPGSLVDRNLQRARNHWAFAQAAARTEGAQVLVDKSMSISRFLELYWTRPASVSLVLVHNVRDGRGTTDSLMRSAEIDVQAAARRWYHLNRRIELVKALFRHVPTQTTHYEQLCRAPEETVEAILDSAGVGRTSAVELTDTLDHGVGGNAGTFQGYDAIRYDERWKRNLSSEEIQTFDATAGRMNQWYGYDEAL